MRRVITVALVALLVVGVLPAQAYAASVDELLHFMGIKTEYEWVDPDAKPEDGNPLAGQMSPTTQIYSFTTKDTPELIAQALSNNHPMLTDGFKRQIPMRDLMKSMTSVKSAVDILTSRGRDDLLALAYLGGYVAPEHEYVSLDPGGSLDSLVPVQNIDNMPLWARGGDIGFVGARAAVPVHGNVRLRSVFGESYAIGTSRYGTEEVVFDVQKDVTVYALFNGYTTYIGSGIVETRSHDQRLTIRYNGVEPAAGVVVGKVFTQGEIMGVSSTYSLGVSMSIDGVARNIMQVFSEDTSKKWFEAWDTRNPGVKEKLSLGTSDGYYHIRLNELDKNVASSYSNPCWFNINPALLTEQDISNQPCAVCGAAKGCPIIRN